MARGGYEFYIRIYGTIRVLQTLEIAILWALDVHAILYYILLYKTVKDADTNLTDSNSKVDTTKKYKYES